MHDQAGTIRLVAGVIILLALAYLWLWLQRPTAEPLPPGRFVSDKPAPASPAPPPADKPVAKEPLDLNLPKPTADFQTAPPAKLLLPGIADDLRLEGSRISRRARDAGEPDISSGNRFGNTQWRKHRFSLESGAEKLDEELDERKRDQAVGVGVTISF